MDEIKDLVFKLIEQDQEDEINKVLALVRLHEIQKELDFVSKQITAWKRDNMNDFEMLSQEYPDGYAGYTFEFRNGGKTFVYDNIQEVADEKKKLKDLEEKYKTAYLSLQKGITPVDEDGVVMEVPEVKYRASSVILKPKK